ncbi:hypothetical protein GH733_017728 [Mirounga leonina]|nr:hypothetical protein GH733_017728 [Mirounga leonina]
MECQHMDYNYAGSHTWNMCWATMSPPHLYTMGSLVKDYFARQENLSPDKIFHIIVTPALMIN